MVRDGQVVPLWAQTPAFTVCEFESHCNRAQPKKKQSVHLSSSKNKNKKRKIPPSLYHIVHGVVLGKPRVPVCSSTEEQTTLKNEVHVFISSPQTKNSETYNE